MWARALPLMLSSEARRCQCLPLQDELNTSRLVLGMSGGEGMVIYEGIILRIYHIAGIFRRGGKFFVVR